MLYAKVSTDKTVTFGPVLAADGTMSSGALAYTDAKIFKNGTDGALNASATFTHKYEGVYALLLKAADLDAVGCYEVVLNKNPLSAAPVKITVLAANVYDWLFGTTAPSTLTQTQVSGGAYDLTNATYTAALKTALGTVPASLAVGAIANDAITAAAIANGAIDAATFAADVGSTALATNMIAKAAEKAIGVAGASLSAIPTIAAVTTVTTTTNLTNLPAITANWLTAAGIHADAGAEIADAVWDEALAGHAGAGSAGSALATASSGGVDPSVLADAIWDEALSGHSTAGTTGKALTDTLADTNELQTNQGNWLTATGFATATELAKVPKSDGTATWNNTALAAIQSECNDALVAYDPPTKAETDTAALTAWTTALTEAYPAYDATSITPAQALYATLQSVSDFAISGLNISVKNLAGTEAMKFTMDSATVPTSRTRVAP
jgi:hypothetical protein